MYRMTSNKHFQKHRINFHKIPLWIQLWVLVTAATAFLISSILVRDYYKNKDSIIRQRISTSQRLLDLEMKNLDQYVKDLSSFCLLPLYDSKYVQIWNQKSAFSSEQIRDIKDLIQNAYYSRSDLKGYQICFLNQEQTYGRIGKAQHPALLPESDIASEEGIMHSSSGKYYNALEPSSDKNCFFSFYQTLIRLQDRSQQAVVKLDVDTSFARSLNQEHVNNGEFICIFNKENLLLYSGNPSVFSEHNYVLSDSSEELSSNGSFTIHLNGESYFGVFCSHSPYGLKLAVFLPLNMIHQEIRSILRANIFTGIFLWMAASVLIYLIIKFSTHPLTKLSAQMKKVGDGDFSPVSDIGGSREITDLAANFNDMTHHIDHLIRQNYLAEINEKTSRLTALEAQLNPHFLYNTLQAIATEALINDQPQIYRMITSLASNLRYSIKSGDLVHLESEITYVQNYVLLQKTRLEDRLEVIFDVDESLLKTMIPKISIQLLVENSIIHGLSPDIDTITIKIHITKQDTHLLITVSDNGCGISPEQLTSMKEDFQNFLHPGTAGKIGLANLYSRLQILFEGNASLNIQSTVGNGTCITLSIPIP